MTLHGSHEVSLKIDANVSRCYIKYYMWSSHDGVAKHRRLEKFSTEWSKLEPCSRFYIIREVVCIKLTGIKFKYMITVRRE